MVKNYFSLILVIALALASNTSTLAQGNGFKVRYNGGTVETKVKGDDWGNTITVSSDNIVLSLKDGQVININPQRVTALSYGKNASRNIKGYAAAAILINPLFALGMIKKNKQHFVGIEYQREDGRKAGLLLQAKNDKYRGLLAALKGVTGREVETETSSGGVEEVPQTISSRTESQHNGRPDMLPAEPQIASRGSMVSADDYNQEGMRLYSLNKLGQAERAFREAVKIDAKNALYHHNLGTAINAQLRYDEAEKEMELAVRLAPDVEEYRKSLEIVRANRGH